MALVVSYNHLCSSSHSLVASLNSVPIPQSVLAMLSQLVWWKAMIEEMNALDASGIWDLVPLLVRKEDIGCRRVFAVKVNFEGLIARLKA